MSTYTDLSLAITYRNVPVRSVQLHLTLIEAIAAAMRVGPSRIDRGDMNYSLTIDAPGIGTQYRGEPARRIRVILANSSVGAKIYCYRHVSNDQFETIGPGETPTAENIAAKFEWLYGMKQEVNV